MWRWVKILRYRLKIENRGIARLLTSLIISVMESMSRAPRFPRGLFWEGLRLE